MGGQFQLYAANDHFAGAVIEVDGVGYEFVSSVTAAEIEQARQ
jgi:hypothetical protein